MKKIFAILVGIALAAMCQLSYAAAAVVSALNGTAQAIPIAGSTRVLRNGDSVNAGDTVATGENSSLVLRFEDGQVVAIGARSRMAVSAYTYDTKEPARSNVLLSLLGGSMRAITGIIGKLAPQKVAYRAGNATMGIRGTEMSVAISGVDVAVLVQDGAIVFTFNGQTVTLPAGQAALTANGKVTTGTVAAINAAVAKNPALAKALGSVSTDAILKAVQDAVKAAAAVKDAADAKAAADKAAKDAADAKAAADKAAKDAADAKAAADKAAKDAADAKAAADKAAKDAADAKTAPNTGNTSPFTGTGTGSTGAGGTGSGGGGKASGG